MRFLMMFFQYRTHRMVAASTRSLLPAEAHGRTTDHRFFPRFARKQKIFPSQYAEQALEMVTEVSKARGKEGAQDEPARYHVCPLIAKAIYIEWLRTPILSTGEYGSRGRFYFCFDKQNPTQSKQLESLANSLFRYVRSKYPMRVKTDYRFNRFVGLILRLPWERVGQLSFGEWYANGIGTQPELSSPQAESPAARGQFGDTGRVRIGRQELSLGSRRLMVAEM
jgi:hypothetical protein